MNKLPNDKRENASHHVSSCGIEILIKIWMRRIVKAERGRQIPLLGMGLHGDNRSEL